MILEALSAGILIGQYIYHRMTEEDPKYPIQRAKIPHVDEGSRIPMIYGMCRVDNPLLAWATSDYDTVITSQTIGGEVLGQKVFYELDMFFVVGIPMNAGVSTTRLQKVIVGDTVLRLSQNFGTIAALSQLEGTGNYERNTRLALFQELATDGRPEILGEVEFLNGGPSQLLVGASTPYTSQTKIGDLMIADGIVASTIPGYRGYACVALHKTFVPSIETEQFVFGSSPVPPAFSFIMSSIPNAGLGLTSSQSVTNDGIGFGANPADVLYDLLTVRLAKLGLPTTYIDITSFTSAANTLLLEKNAYSRAIQEDTAENIVKEILKQIDGILYVDPTTDKIGLRLVRADYDPDTVDVISPTTCRKLDYSANGWNGIVNKVRVAFPDVNLNFQENSAVAHNIASSSNVAILGDELRIDYPGCNDPYQAGRLAQREISARSRPLAKAVAECNSSFYTKREGDVVAVNWPEYGVGNVLMRIVRIERGVLSDDHVRVELLQESFFLYRSTIAPPIVAPFPGNGAASAD